MAFERAYTVGARLVDGADLEFGTPVAPDIALDADGTGVMVSGTGLFNYPDDIFIVSSDGDAAARMRFECGGVTTGNTRVLTVDDADSSLVLTPGNQVIADPGNGMAIGVTRSGNCALVTGGAETRTLAIPTAVGQVLSLHCTTYGGKLTITVAAAFNVANKTLLVWTAVSQACGLIGVTVAGALVWQITWNDGVTLG